MDPESKIPLPKVELETAAHAKTAISKKLIKLVAVVAIILLAIAGFLIYQHYQDHQKTKYQVQEDQAYKTLVKKVTAQNLKGQGIENKTDLMNFLSSSSAYINKSQTQWIDEQLATVYIAQKDYKNAIIWLQQAISNESQVSYNDYISLSQMYANLQDKTNALKYLKLAFSTLENDKVAKQEPDFALQANAIQNQINQLEK